MAQIRRGWFVLGSNIFLIAGTFLFLSGLLRPKAIPSTIDSSWVHDVQKTASAPFDRVVFMLVDALRRFILTYPKSSQSSYANMHNNT